MSENFKPLNEQVAAKMAAGLKDGTSILQTSADKVMALPYNLETGKPYKGPAALILLMQEREDPRWGTTNQANFNHASVAPGSKGTLINFFSSTEMRPVMKDGEQVMKENGKPQMEKIILDKPVLVDAWLFNAKQLNNLPELVKEPQSLSPAERAQQIMDNSKVVLAPMVDSVFYDQVSDRLHIAEKEQFESVSQYYAVALHEMAHGAGNEKRLNLNFGSVEGMAKEELRTNLASLLINAELGLPNDIGNHQEFEPEWIALLENEPKELFKAAADAQKIADLILGFEQKIEIGKDTAAERLTTGEIIPYNDTKYEVIKELKNNVYQMKDQGTGNKFKMTAEDGLFASLVNARNNSQEVVIAQEAGVQEEQEQEEEQDNTYAIGR
jgi:antirestriction protein ArdC